MYKVLHDEEILMKRKTISYVIMIDRVSAITVMVSVMTRCHAWQE